MLLLFDEAAERSGALPRDLFAGFRRDVTLLAGRATGFIRSRRAAVAVGETMTGFEIQDLLVAHKNRYPHDRKWWRRYYKLRAAFYRCDEWKALRLRVIEKYKVCTLCHKNGKDVHHKVPIFAYPMLILEFTNLILVCRKCHKLIHKSQKDGLSPPVKS